MSHITKVLKAPNKPELTNQDAEIAVLGAVLIDGNVIEPISSILKPEDFYVTKHQKLFKTMCEMNTNGINIDVVTFCKELTSKGIFEEIGDFSYINHLIEITPSSANYRYYANIVKESSRLRQISLFNSRLNNNISNGKLDSIQARQLISEFNDKISTEYSDSDEILCLAKEPLPPDREWLLEDFLPMDFPTTLYSNGGSGKSYLAVHLAIKICLGNETFLNRRFYSEPINTLYLDFELDKIELTRRALEVAKAMGMDAIPANFFYKSPESKISSLLRELPGFIKNNDIKFLVIDSMGSAGLDSLDEKSVIEVYSKLRQLGLSTLVIDHQSKMQSQDSPDNKSPFGSVYKYNMSRSVIHLVHEKNIENGFTVKLVHKKSNFGKLCDEELIDMVFDDDRVCIQSSQSISQQEEEMLMIKDAITEMLQEQEQVIQKDLIEHFSNTISKNRLIYLLKKGESKHWNKVKGNTKNTVIYIPTIDTNNLKIQKTQKSDHIDNGNSGFLETDSIGELDNFQ